MTPSSGSVFSETLHTITTTKLEELAKQRQSFENDYAQLLDASKAEKDSLKRVCLLQDGVKSCLGVGGGAGSHDDQVVKGGARNIRLETDLKNLDRFLEQARFDPSVSQKVLGDWEATLLRYLEVQSARFQYADLYGKLVTEWLSPDKSKSTDNDVEMAESFEELPGAKKLAARTEWEKSVFEPAEIDVDALELYLNHLFDMGDKAGETAIQTLIRDKVTVFEYGLANRPLTHNNLVQTIDSLQKSDLLSDDKREALKDFLGNSVILAEINDILNVRMSALDRWNWGDHVSVEQRRMLNGGFSIQFDPDLLQAIFLHYIGNMWSVFFKKTFEALLEHTIWKKSHANISKTDRMRRTYFLGNRGLAKNNSLQNKRIRVHRNRYFAHQLLDYASQAIEMQDGEEEADFSEYAQQTMQMPMAAMANPPPPAKRVGRTKQTARKSTGGKAPRMQLASTSIDLDFGYQLVDEEGHFEKEEEEEDDSGESDEEVNDDDYRGGPKKPMESKQKLLHVVSTEIIVNTRLHGELTCFRTVFDSWNPLLPHDTITTVLKFFGVSAKWRKFFVKFLQAPLKFTEDENSEPRVRRRGAPGAHTLSDVFSEVIFFCLDFSINKGTDGAVVHRLYDDIWFWNKDYETCARAWSKVQEFSNVMNVSLDEKKTGSVRVTTDGRLTVDDRLPKGQIRWGFLVLDSKTGRFEIDKNMVNGHVEELREQLDGKSKSVIDWIQAWNSYAATFFSSNFGQAANCFGREHVDDMLATHRHIQESIFQGGNVVSYLKSLIEDRFGVKNIPDGFLFFPVELGGLDLKSPFVDLLQIRESVVENPQKLLIDFLELEEEDYYKAKRKFDNGVIRHPNVSWEQVGKANEDAHDFFPFEEFTKHREDFARYDKANLRQTYSLLLLRPQMQPIQVTKHISQYLDELGGKHNLRSITSSWHHMESYWKWVTQMYGPEMTERFGGLNVVDFGLLPIGMVSMFRERRTKWRG